METKNPEDTKLNNLLFDAAARGDSLAVHVHVRDGAEINAHAVYALRLAAKNGHKDTARLLTSRGADFGRALSYAAYCGDVKTTTNLLAFMPDLSSSKTLRAAFEQLHQTSCCPCPHRSAKAANCAAGQGKPPSPPAPN
jgi:hypothetical protein